MVKGTQCCPPPMRWTVFLILSLCMFSYMYTYDTPVALQEQLQHEPYDLSNVQYNLLFSAYAWPNIIFPIIFGVLTDIVGVNKMLILLYLGMLIGNGIFVLGIQLNDFIVMLIGRCFYGISAESFAMAETPLLYEYFFGKELSFALGFNLSFSRLGSALNDVLTYKFYNMYGGAKGVVFAMSMGAFVLMPFCLIFLSVLIIYRIYFEDVQVAEKRKKMSLMKHKMSNDDDDDNRSNIGMTTKLIGNNNEAYDAMQETLGGYNDEDMSARMDVSMASKYDYSMSQQQNSQNQQILTMDDHDDDEEDDYIKSALNDHIDDADLNETALNRFRFTDFKQFDTRYWLLVVNCCFQYGCVVPWMKIGGSYMQVKYGYAHHKANEYLMIPYIVAAVLTPLIGYGVDKLGRRCQLLLIATIILTISHYILGWVQPTDVYLDENDQNTLPLIGLIGLGLGYSVFCAVIWPAFAVVIPPKLVGTGYGIPTSAYNLVLGVFFLLVGVLTKDDEDLEDVSIDKYTDVEWFLLSTCLCSIGTVFMLWHADKTMGNMLGLPAKKQVLPSDVLGLSAASRGY